MNPNVTAWGTKLTTTDNHESLPKCDTKTVIQALLTFTIALVGLAGNAIVLWIDLGLSQHCKLGDLGSSPSLAALSGVLGTFPWVLCLLIWKMGPTGLQHQGWVLQPDPKAST